MTRGISSANDPQFAASGKNGEYLSFRLGREEFGIDVAKVQEIRGYEEPTAVPNVPGYIKGVLSLRNVIVPIVDMRIKLKLRDARYDELTAVIVLIAGNRMVGMVVDSVGDVIELAPEQIQPAPTSSSTIAAEHFTGKASVDKRTLILLDIEKLMTSKDMVLTEMMR